MSFITARSRPSGRRAAAVATACVAALVLSACALDGEADPAADPDSATEDAAAERDSATEDAGAVGVPAGASQEEFVAALADMDPVTLSIQTPTPANHPVTEAYEDYAEAVTEWSGGAINFEFAYASSLAGATDIFNALADGRLDMSYTAPSYDPTLFSAHDSLLRVTHLGDHDAVVGMLQSNAAFLELALETPDIIAEYENNGTVALLPYYPTDQNGFACTKLRTTPAEAAGAQTRISARVHAEQLGALGMSPVSLDFTETFEGLQRGVVDCAMFPLFGAQFTQLLTVAPHFMVDTQVSTSVGLVGFGIGRARWDSLPLAAQQLLHDRLDVLIESALIHNIWETEVAGLATIAERDGAVVEFSSDLREALSAVNETIVEGVRAGDQVADGEGFVNDALAALDKWKGIVADAGFAEPVAYADLADWYVNAEPDLTAYMEQVRAQILEPNRPS